MSAASRKDDKEANLLLNSHSGALEYQQKNQENDKAKSFHESEMRWLVLFFATLLLLGDYSCFDNPQALQDALQNGSLKLSFKEYNLFYTVYSIPNLFLPFFGGIIVDKLGVRVGIFVCSTILMTGQFIWMIGGIYEYYPLMLLGRIVFGVGGEVLVVAQNTFIFKWFRSRELSFAFGFTVSMNNISGTLNASLIPYLFSINRTFFLPLIVSFLFCFISWLSGLVVVYIDKESDRRDKVKMADQGGGFFKFDDLKKFPLVFWLLCLICFFVSGGFYIFVGNANQMIVTLFHQTPTSAGLYLMILFGVITVLTPFYGKFTDNYNKRGFTLVGATILMALAILIILLLPTGSSVSHIVPILIVLGIGFGTYSSTFWTSIPLIVGEDREGSALGLITSLQNLNFILSSIIFGTISDKTLDNNKGFFWGEFFLFVQFVISFLLALVLNACDRKTGGVLNNKTAIKEE